MKITKLKTIARFCIVASLVAVISQGCATMKEVQTETLDTTPGEALVHGKVVNIVQLKKDASLLKQFGGSLIGAMIGGQVGGGSTQYIVGTAGAFIGQDVVNNLYGSMVDKLEVEDANGKSYEFLIQGHGFRVTDKVIITVKDDKVSSVIHESLYKAHAIK